MITGEETSWSELRPILDEELDHLPEKFRAPLVLCYLKGKTVREVDSPKPLPFATVDEFLVRLRAASELPSREERWKAVHELGLTLSLENFAAAEEGIPSMLARFDGTGNGSVFTQFDAFHSRLLAEWVAADPADASSFTYHFASLPLYCRTSAAKPGAPEFGLEHLQDFGLFLEFDQGSQLLGNEIQIQFAALSLQNAFDIQPVLVPTGEAFVDDQILSRACQEPNRVSAESEIVAGSPLNRPLLERHRAERDIERRTLRCLEENDPCLQCEFPGIRPTPAKFPKESINKGFFPSETCQERQVRILGQARFTPPLDRDSSNEAELPVPAFAEGLDLQRRLVNVL